MWGIEIMSDVEKDVNEQDIDHIVALLDHMNETGVSRLKVQVSDTLQAGETKRVYHHGRCDVGSPWARGEAFDVLETE